ncbi:hydrogenase maturation protease [Methanoplanus sp. FWC-SCC4]|uniref:Hydrogenase maturation protease n=1 Tax=Methanochimaera problematica TaxID=2609417 RepID=A0AA97I576_9EURY|nr:hydrogenase maturation protease [Methanoplanus sp. FWC-SCC4]WOF17161.1 hydrogenase maturation protease [Methanoplanus sp. FWC-SCC4]
MIPVKTRIIACGNPLMGNDGVGLKVMEMLLLKNPALDIIDGGTGGLGLIPDMEGYDRIIIVDAMIGIGKNKGDVLVFTKTPPVNPSQFSIHDAGISEVIEIAAHLIPETEIITLGIEAGSIKEYTATPDPEVIRGAEKASDCIEKILAGEIFF